MADWFRFYENAIDEPRFATAISEVPEVLPVFVLLLSEHCRNKSGRIAWTGDEYELRGLARKVGLTVERFKAALGLLEAIHYITLADGKLTTPGWSSLQSDYCQRRTRLQNQEGDNHHTAKTPNTVRTLSEHSPDSVPQEERRGEEKRIKKRVPAQRLQLAPVAIPASLDTLAFISVWCEWKQHRQEIRKPLKPTAERQQLRTLEAMGLARAVAALRYSMTNGWQGVFEPKVDPRQPPAKGTIVDRELLKLQRQEEMETR